MSACGVALLGPLPRPATVIAAMLRTSVRLVLPAIDEGGGGDLGGGNGVLENTE